MNSLDDLRNRINEVDREILRLLSKRVELARKIGELKKMKGIPIVDYERELEVLARGRKLAEELGLDKELVELALRAIIGICRKAQSPLKVAFLGPRGSFSEEAAVKAFLSQGAEFHPMPSIRDIFRAAECGDVEYGLVPVENSLEGGVGETLDLLVDTSLRICGEIKIKISMNLIARPGLKLQDIKLVLSRPLISCPSLSSWGAASSPRHRSCRRAGPVGARGPSSPLRRPRRPAGPSRRRGSCSAPP
mgnify:CR=1 FL=1